MLRSSVERIATRQSTSSYYPPRARWYTSLFFNASKPLRRQFHLEKIRLPGGLSAGRFCLSLLVPGFAFYACGQLLLGGLLFAGHLLAALIFIAALGFFAANVAYGLMIAVHATSIVYLEGL